jgi:hypothetical protein
MLQSLSTYPSLAFPFNIILKSLSTYPSLAFLIVLQSLLNKQTNKSFLAQQNEQVHTCPTIDAYVPA